MIKINLLLEKKRVGNLTIKNSESIENTDQPITVEVNWEDNKELKEVFYLSFSESYYLYGHRASPLEEVSKGSFQCPSLNDLEEALLNIEYFDYSKENFPDYQIPPISGENNIIF